MGRKRWLDLTPLYDAVATMDTVTLVGSGDPRAAEGRRRGSGGRAAGTGVPRRRLSWPWMSLRAIITMRPRARRWWMRGPRRDGAGPARAHWAASWPPRSTRRPNRWPPWSARTSTGDTKRVFPIARRAGPRIGGSPPWTRRRASGARPPLTALTATRATSATTRKRPHIATATQGDVCRQRRRRQTRARPARRQPARRPVRGHQRRRGCGRRRRR